MYRPYRAAEDDREPRTSRSAYSNRLIVSLGLLYRGNERYAGLLLHANTRLLLVHRRNLQNCKESVKSQSACKRLTLALARTKRTHHFSG